MFGKHLWALLDSVAITAALCCRDVYASTFPRHVSVKQASHSADLLNVFETFLPQLLLYPNPTDPLNGEAAALLMREPEAYNAKVKGRSVSHPPWLSMVRC